MVVGRASGIGLAAEKRLAADGATVVVADLNGERALSAAAEIGGGASGEAVQVTEEATARPVGAADGGASGRPALLQ